MPGVGYPNPNRSHFESMAIWHSARLDVEERDGPGWIGRGLDDGPTVADGPASSLFVGAGSVPVALRGAARSPRRSSASRTSRSTRPPGRRGTSRPPHRARTSLRSSAGARSTPTRRPTASTRLARAVDRGPAYPQSGLGNRLQMVARLLKGGHPARVFYTAQSGYDTHAGQSATHYSLLNELSDALLAFQDDLAGAKLADRVLVMSFSEFGRRVAENGSAGTDHGTAGPVFLAGPSVKPGLAGAYPQSDRPRLRRPEDDRRLPPSLRDPARRLARHSRPLGAGGGRSSPCRC